MEHYRSFPKALFIGLLLAVISLMSLGVLAHDRPSSFSSSLVSDTEHLLDLAATDQIEQLNCRYGVAALGSVQTPWVDTLNAGWYLSFVANPPGVIPQKGAEFVHVVRVGEDFNSDPQLAQLHFSPALTNSALGVLIAANPGALWLIGNEPDVVGQDPTRPRVYARAYQAAYQFIKQRDPSAQVGIAGLSMITPGRLQYLDIVYDAYLEYFNHPIPVDVWNFHAYVLAEIRPWDGQNADGQIAIGTDPALAYEAPLGADPALCSLPHVRCRADHDHLPHFVEQVVAIRTWMKAKGQQNKPLILSEFGTLYPFVDYDDPISPTICFLMDERGNCFTQPRVISYMNATFNYLDQAIDQSLGYPQDNYRLVQQWLWFSLHVDPEWSGGSSNLLKDDYAAWPPGSVGAFSSIGANMQAQIAQRPLSYNLRASRAHTVIAYTQGSAQTVDVPLQVDILNNGNRALASPFMVTFYRDSALTQVIGSQLVEPPLRGCARYTYQASVTWPGLGPGVHRYWVKVNSGGLPGEPMQDNVAQGLVMVNPLSNYLPLIKR